MQTRIAKHRAIVTGDTVLTNWGALPVIGQDVDLVTGKPLLLVASPDFSGYGRYVPLEGVLLCI